MLYTIFIKHNRFFMKNPKTTHGNKLIKSILVLFSDS